MGPYTQSARRVSAPTLCGGEQMWSSRCHDICLLERRYTSGVELYSFTSVDGHTNACDKLSWRLLCAATTLFAQDCHEAASAANNDFCMAVNVRFAPALCLNPEGRTFLPTSTQTYRLSSGRGGARRTSSELLSDGCHTPAVRPHNLDITACGVRHALVRPIVRSPAALLLQLVFTTSAGVHTAFVSPTGIDKLPAI
jgi:hypothetical protein